MYRLICDFIVWCFYKNEYVTKWCVYFTADNKKDTPMKCIKIITSNGWNPTALTRKLYPKAVIHSKFIDTEIQLFRWEQADKYVGHYSEV